MHRSHLDVFDFNTKKISHYGVVEDEWMYDVAFDLSNDGRTLDICKAEVGWADYNTWQVEIVKGKKLFSDVEKFEFRERG